MSMLNSFRTVRWLRTINLVLQAVLFLTFFGGLNYLALRHGSRFDLTTYRRYSLSAETKSYLENLSGPVKLIVTITNDDTNPEAAHVYRDVAGLLREYVYETEKSEHGRITVDYLDVYLRRREAEALGIDKANAIVAISGDKKRIISLPDLYHIEDGVRKSFTGEQALTAAIIDLSSARKQKVYFTVGHGELSLSDTDAQSGLSGLETLLRERNFELAPIDFNATRRVPDDADLVIIAGGGRFEPYQEELLRDYLSNRAGRVIALLPPQVNHGLENLLFDWGLLADDVVVVDPAAGETETGELIVSPTLNPHPVNELLGALQLAVRLSLARSVRPDLGRPLDNSLIVTPLLATSKTGWGEFNYRRNLFRLDQGVDIPGPVPVAAASERIKPKDIQFSVRGGRVVAFGDSLFVANGRLSTQGNTFIILAAINWCADRTSQIAIRPRPIERFQLSLTQEELLRLRYSLLFALPAVAAGLGLIVYWTRRR